MTTTDVMVGPRAERAHEHAHVQNRFAVIPTPERLKADTTREGRGVCLAFLDSGFYPHPDLVEPRNRIVAFKDISGDEAARESHTLAPERFGPPRVEGGRLVFFHHDDAAVTVSLAGDFNDWRPAPSDEQANDLLHWQTGLVTSNPEGLAELLGRARYTLVSDGITAVPVDTLGFRRGFLVADPDGHVCRVAEY